VWTARALFACIYFFPGLHKLLGQGFGWASAENLSLQLYWKWFEWGEVPHFRLDEHPALLVGGGLGVLAFELGFPLLLRTPRTRVVAAIAGVAFHVAAERTLRIPFSSLWLCYPVLVDWARRDARAPSPARLRTSRFEVAVYAALLTGAIVQGVRGQMRAFPFACYPTFEARPPREVPDLRLIAVRADGSREDVPHARDGRGVRPQTSWGRIWALCGATEPANRERLRAYVAEVARGEPRRFDGVVQVEARRAYYRVRPEARGEGPERQERLAVFERDGEAWR
jgi:hypothetical protein